MMMRLPAVAPATVFDAFVRAAGRYADRPFLAVTTETSAAYGIAAAEIAYDPALQIVGRLRDVYRAKGYGHGHRVGLLLERRPDFFWHWLALNALGVSIVPISRDLRATELEYIIAHSNLVAIIAVESAHPGLHVAAAAAGAVPPVVAPAADPAAVENSASPRAPGRGSECALLYTSGTTGNPKGCVLPNEYFLYAGHWYATAGGLIALHEGTERMLTPLPFFHMNALAFSAMAMIVTGGCLIPLDRFHPKTWWAAVKESRATIVHYLGVMPSMLMNAPQSADDKAHNVRFGFGAGVDSSLHKPFETRFGFPLIEAWAMTETGAGAVVSANREPRHVGTNCFGKPGRELEVRVMADDGSEAATDQPGELLVRHAGTDHRYGFFREYLNDPAATAAAWQGGWFRTGDVVRRGADGSLHFVDRKKNVIRRSGENISAVEVEGVLLRHPAVRHAAVAPAPDALRGDEVFACVVTNDPLTDDAAAQKLAGELVAWCLSRLAYYKAPGYIAFVPALPMTSTQKIQRGSLKDLVAATVGTGACIDTRAMKKRAPA
jgi:acyl-CoA synthetase (AMP-forming)/AMP-acid ligase II